jgi:hypothetical protein
MIIWGGKITKNGLVWVWMEVGPQVFFFLTYLLDIKHMRLYTKYEFKRMRLCNQFSYISACAYMRNETESKYGHLLPNISACAYIRNERFSAVRRVKPRFFEISVCKLAWKCDSRTKRPQLIKFEILGSGSPWSVGDAVMTFFQSEKC